MAGDELLRRRAVAMLAPALRPQLFFLAFQHRDPSDFLKITGEAGIGRQDRPGGAGDVRPALTSFETKLSVSGRLSS